MTTNTSQVAGRNPTGPTTQSRAQTTKTAITPPLDIFEDSEGITLEADMPGVSKDRLQVHVEGENLLLEGELQFDLPEQAQALYADLRSTIYRCSLVLSRELESEKIQANLKDGVLRVRIPKRAELQPRRIEVQGS
jgi:HSP20 family molecular chaperone IbpA